MLPDSRTRNFRIEDACIAGSTTYGPPLNGSYVPEAGKKTSMLLADAPIKTLMCRLERQTFRRAHAKGDVKSEYQIK